MSDAMVTGRMSKEKKEEGNRVLASLGSNPSKVINQLYDYLIENRHLPFAEVKEQHRYTEQEIAEARKWALSLPRKNRFSVMTDEQIRQERLAKRNLVVEEGLDEAAS